MDPRIELNGGTSAPTVEEPVVTAGFGASAPPATVVITSEAVAPATAEPKSGRRGPTGRFRRTVLVAWIIASVFFAAAGALTVTAVGQHGRLASTRTALAAEVTRTRSLKGRISDLASAKAGLESKVADLQGTSDHVGRELRTCVNAVNSMDRLINAMLDAFNATSAQAFNREIQRVDRLAQPTWDARGACLGQPDAGATSV